MASGRNTVTLYTVLISGALLVGMIWSAPWPMWASCVLALTPAAMVVLLAQLASRRTGGTHREMPDFGRHDRLPAEHEMERVGPVLLPSNREDYEFQFSATVLWSPLQETPPTPSVNTAALAREAVIRRAHELTCRREPGNVSLVQHELAGVLARMEEDTTGLFQAMARSVKLALSDDDRQRLDKLAKVRKEKAVWEHERKYEQSRREYLGGDVLKDTASAVVWWLARNDDHVEKTVRDIGLLAQLSSAANNVPVPEGFQRLVSDLTPPRTPHPGPNESNGSGTSQNGTSFADHMDGLLGALDFVGEDPRRTLLARQLADLFARYGRADMAEELTRRFDAPDGAECQHGTGSRAGASSSAVQS